MENSKPQLGVIGLGTMGANLARNAARNGATVAVFNRTTEKTDDFMKKHKSEGDFVACHTLKDLAKKLEKPRHIVLMVKAGDAVDDMMDELIPILDKGDVLIDAGNSHFKDTERREAKLKRKGLKLIGMGVSGGEEGALHGPSMMPGGDKESVERLMPLLKKMAAEDGSAALTTGGNGGKCVAYMGKGGAGHFVKMVHNGIEYGLMQLIAETYDLMKSVGHSTNEELAQIYAEWNKDDLQSFLLDITSKAFQKKDDESGEFLIDRIKDAAGQKGTGKWTTEAAMNLGVAIPTITAAVDARILSSEPDLRRQLNAENPESLPEPFPELKSIPALCHSALLLSFIATFGQGWQLLTAASKEYKWNLPMAEIARIWRGGCIIRCGLLARFQEIFSARNDEERNVAKTRLLDLARGERQIDWRRLIAIATSHGVPVPALSASLAYADSIRRLHLPQNLIQAQRDFFGAHTYQRTDREGTFHTEWK